MKMDRKRWRKSASITVSVPPAGSGGPTITINVRREMMTQD
jgi:hypothetical protein